MNKSESPGHLQHGRRPRDANVNSDDIAIQALKFFANEPEEAQRFFAWSGLQAGDLRSAVGQSGFTESLFDYLMQDEAVLVSFARHAGLDPGALARAGESLRARQGWSGEDI